jgi:hypothetical protein
MHHLSYPLQNPFIVHDNKGLSDFDKHVENSYIQQTKVTVTKDTRITIHFDTTLPATRSSHTTCRFAMILNLLITH